ncbi:SWIM zinc finger family protein [Methanocrinis sp.]|uniref:SWIM zinc finger family protein n=1 Tax=Methanocrinis sp. TaxID=3101522 RepID=UPI003D0E90A0
MKTRPLKREEFEGRFEDKILERGRRCFEEDRVDDPIIVDGVVLAKVHGTATYSVEVDPERMIFRCSCPYFDTYGNCKHLAALLYRLAEDPEVESLDETIRTLERRSKKELIALLKSIMRAEPKFRHLLTGDVGDLNREVRGLKDGFLDADPDLFLEKMASMRRLIMLFERPKFLALSKDLFVELYHLFYDFGGVEFLEDEMYLILETIAPELEEMDEGTREEMMKDIRAIYEKDDSVLKSFMYEPVKEYLN